MKIKNPKFEKSCIKADQLPDSNLLEIAFAGRSNVGKSSLINALLGRKNLAHSGSKQGMTRLINFYNIDDEIHFVDLPGYGYAKVAKSEMGLWGEVIENYLNVRKQLYVIVLIVDIRHEPSADDELMYSWILQTGLKFIVVANKADKVSKQEAKKCIEVIKKKFCMGSQDVVYAVSSESKKGIPELWEKIDSFIMEDSQ